MKGVGFGVRATCFITHWSIDMSSQSVENVFSKGVAPISGPRSACYPTVSVK